MRSSEDEVFETRAPDSASALPGERAPPAITANPLRRDEVLDPYGEERGTARLEPRGHRMGRHDSAQVAI